MLNQLPISQLTVRCSRQGLEAGDLELEGLRLNAIAMEGGESEERLEDGDGGRRVTDDSDAHEEVSKLLWILTKGGQGQRRTVIDCMVVLSVTEKEEYEVR